MTGAEAVIRCLEAEGVEICWGIPGGAILPLYDAWARVEHTVAHVLVRHEQGAGHMAQGYARATGKVGVCMAHVRPGRDEPRHAGRRRVPRLHPARRDHRPGADAPDRHRRLPGGRHDRHLHADRRSTPTSSPTSSDLPRVMKEAFHIARTGRPGPVLVDIPKDIANAMLDFHYPETVDLPGYQPDPQRPSAADPGGGRGDREGAPARALRRRRRASTRTPRTSSRVLAEAAADPGRDDADGQGRVPRLAPALRSACPACTARSTRTGRMNRADLLITIGARFDDRVTGKLDAFAPGRQGHPHATSTRPRSRRTATPTSRSSAS